MASPFTIVSAADAYSGTSYRTLYTVPAGKQAFIKSIIASNKRTSSSSIATLEYMDGGTTPIQLAISTLAANASSNLLAGTLTLSAGESLRQKADVNQLLFSDLVHSATGSAYSDPTVSDFIYANGTYVAVGSRSGTDPYNNFVLTSTNGTTWTWRDVDTGTNSQRYLSSIAYGAGLFVVVGGGGFIATSPNGTTWTTRTSALSTNDINHVIYAGGRFVAVGGTTSTTSIQTSTDGITWTARTGAIGTITYSGAAQVAYDPTSGLYAMSCGGSGSGGVGLQTSPDGTTWTARMLPMPNAVVGVQAKAGLFVAKTNTTSVWNRSTDGINWTLGGSAGSTYAEATNQFKYVNGLFVSCGTSALAWSTDGVFWTECAYASGVSGVGVSRVIPLHDGTNWYFASYNNQASTFRVPALSTANSQTLNWVASVIEVAA